MNYDHFLESKHESLAESAFPDADIKDSCLAPFQQACTTFGLRRGRVGLFEDCGLGKTRQFLVWGHYVSEWTEGARVLVVCPLAVAGQIKREADLIGVAATIARNQSQVAARGISVTNYEMLKHFDPREFAAVVLDEGGILKAYTGRTKIAILDMFKDTRFKLSCTATPAPNDLLELLNQGEFLGQLNSHEAIARWFTNTDKAGVYRLRHWARDKFWDWVTSWARCLSKPSDLGFDDTGYTLPELRRTSHVLSVDVVKDRGDDKGQGRLYRDPNLSAARFHEEGRRTSADRARKVAELVTSEPGEPWIIWCDTDYDDDAVRALLPDAVSVRGSGVLRGGKVLKDIEAKEQAVLDFCDGSIGRIIAKKKMFGFGLNLQWCARMVSARPSYSYEQDYQGERRCYRFGQLRAVEHHTVMASTEVDVYAANRRKADAHATMIREMYEAAARANGRREQRFADYDPKKTMQLPEWIRSEVA